MLETDWNVSCQPFAEWGAWMRIHIVTLQSSLLKLASIPVISILLVATYFLTIRPGQLRWGATDDEVARSMPQDDIVPRPAFNATRALPFVARPIRFGPGWHKWATTAPDITDMTLLKTSPAKMESVARTRLFQHCNTRHRATNVRSARLLRCNLDGLSRTIILSGEALRIHPTAFSSGLSRLRKSG